MSPDSDENYFKVRLPTLNLQFKLHDDISNPMNESLIYRIRPWIGVPTSGPEIYKLQHSSNKKHPHKASM